MVTEAVNLLWFFQPDCAARFYRQEDSPSGTQGITQVKKVKVGSQRAMTNGCCLPLLAWQCTFLLPVCVCC